MNKNKVNIMQGAGKVNFDEKKFDRINMNMKMNMNMNDGASFSRHGRACNNIYELFDRPENHSSSSSPSE